MVLETYYRQNVMEVGVDEVGRGCMFGPVYAAAVYWDPEIKSPLIRDSKQLSKRKRDIASDFIKENCIAYGIASCSNVTIDKINILQASIKAMHRAIDDTHISPQHILVDGNKFKFYLDRNGDQVSHTCVTKGDDKYYSIAAASILAKVARDNYIIKLCDEDPSLEKYGLRENVGYGSQLHMKAIEQHGITPYHRRTFGICKDY